MYKNPNYLYGPKELDVPVHLNFGRYILDKMWEFRNNVAIINGVTDERITYSEILDQSINFAVSLTRMGTRKGEVIGLFSENRFEYWGVVCGVVSAGGVVTTLSTGYVGDELKHVLNISKPSKIICSPTMYKQHQKLLKTLPFIKKIILFGDEKKPNTLLFKEMLNNKVKYESFECVEVNGQTDTLFIIYSSGTTGMPKGVELTHLNLIAACCLPVSQSPKELTFSVSPWYHVMGLAGSLTGMSTGRTGVFIPKFDIDTYLKTIDKYKISQLVVVPPVLVAVCKSSGNYDLSSVKLVYSGAAPLHKETVNAVCLKFPNVTEVMQGYGASEVTLAVTRFNYVDRANAKTKIGSVGSVVNGCILKIVDIETRIALGPNKQGEICVKGPNIMKGYVGIGRGDFFDDEGFYKTGDVGYYDEDGFLFIEDRLKELIKYKGYQVPPAELEALLLSHEAVKDVGVIGVQQKQEEVPLAFIVKQPNKNVSEEQLKTFVAERLSNPKHLRGGVRFVEAIPKSASGKILRNELRKITKTLKSKL